MALAGFVALASALSFSPAASSETPTEEEQGRSVPTTTITVPDQSDQAAPVRDATVPNDLPEVSKSIEDLPQPVQRMREAIMDAALTGNVERMRVAIQMGELPPAMALHEGEDAIDHLRAISGDEEGREILAIILEILEAGYAHMEPGTEREIFLWPYFAGLPFAALDPIQEVELYRIITPHDRAEMESHTGQYTFFRIGISKDGTWQYLLTGD
ncbi:MAG: hypothetical protein AAGD23_13325 [Pseudomonadota bacterium]